MDSNREEDISWGEIIKIVIISLAIVLPIRFFIFQPVTVKGSCMEPTLLNHDYLIVDEFVYRDIHQPQRGDIIVFHYPRNPRDLFVKRVIALPGETIKIYQDKVFIKKEGGDFVPLKESYLPSNDHTTQGKEEITLNSDQYFVMGDNRRPGASWDSRYWGPLSRKYIVGRADLKLWHFPPEILYGKENKK